MDEVSINDNYVSEGESDLLDEILKEIEMEKK